MPAKTSDEIRKKRWLHNISEVLKTAGVTASVLGVGAAGAHHAVHADTANNNGVATATQANTPQGQGQEQTEATPQGQSSTQGQAPVDQNESTPNQQASNNQPQGAYNGQLGASAPGSQLLGAASGGGGANNNNNNTSSGGGGSSSTGGSTSSTTGGSPSGNGGQQQGGSGNGTQGGGNGTQGDGNGTNGGGNGSPANDPNNGDNPNNGQPNNSNPNNDDPNNVVVPGHSAGHTSNNNNIVPNGSVVNNNDANPGGYNYDNVDNHNYDAFIAALTNNENRNENDALDRLDQRASAEASNVASETAAQNSLSAEAIQRSERGMNQLQINSMNEAARITSLKNRIAYNSKQGSMAQSALNVQHSYMNYIDSQRANVNSAAQGTLDSMDGYGNLTPSQRQGAMNAIQQAEHQFMSQAVSTNSAGANTDLAAGMNSIKASMSNEESADQTSQADSANDQADGIAKAFNNYIDSFKGLTPQQRNDLLNRMKFDLNNAKHGFTIDKSNKDKLSSLVTNFSSEADQLKGSGLADSTANSNAARASAESAAAIARQSIENDASGEISALNYDNLPPEDRSTLIGNIKQSAENQIAETRAQIMAGINNSAPSSNKVARRIARRARHGAIKSHAGYKSHSHNFTPARGGDHTAFEQGYHDAMRGEADRNKLDHSVGYHSGYAVYRNGYSNGLSGNPAMQNYYTGGQLQAYTQAYNAGQQATGNNAGNVAAMNVGTNAESADNSMSVPSSVQNSGNSNTQSNNNNRTLPKTGEQDDTAAKVGAAAASTMGLLAGAGAHRRRHDYD